MSSHMYKSVSFVPSDSMCTGCGICSAVCPHDAINIKIDERKGVYQSHVDPDTCTNCTICLTSCPPLTWSNKPVTNTYHHLVGDYVATYATHSNDEAVRFNAASGGFITSLLVYLLENKYISGAVVVKRDDHNPLISRPFVATTVEEIKEAKGSKYSPVKFDMILKEIMEKDYENLAIVGLPCHIEGIAKACKKSKKIKNKIKYKISIVCGQAPSFLGYEYIAKKFGIQTSEITGLKNRGNGWPGYMQINTEQTEIKVPYGSKYSMGMVLSSPLFTPLACQMCADPVGFDADISVSDAWLDKYIGDKKGMNLILIKSHEIDTIVKQMNAEKTLTLFDETINDFIKANSSVIYNKGKYNHFRLDQFIGDNRRMYSKKMTSPKELQFMQKIKLMIFTSHLIIIRKLHLGKLVSKLNDPILFYFKVLNLLKR